MDTNCRNIPWSLIRYETKCSVNATGLVSCVYEYSLEINAVEIVLLKNSVLQLG